MYVLLSLIETLCKSLEEPSNDDLVGGDNALQYLKFSGFKVDWLEKKLEEVKEKKKEEQIGETRMQEMKVFKQKCSDIEALMEREKSKLLVTRGSPLTLDDVL
jgi:glucan phosphoethanolaminetransferase (alkaline phosphatase superfamily)